MSPLAKEIGKLALQALIVIALDRLKDRPGAADAQARATFDEAVRDADFDSLRGLYDRYGHILEPLLRAVLADILKRMGR